MIPVSIIIITLNEEKKITKCLDSIINISDDIIVIDSFSKDKTKTLCTSYKNVKFIENRFINYSQQRNFALRFTKYNYVLNIDADEFLSPQLQESFLKLQINESSNILYSFNRLNFYCGKPVKFGGWNPDIKKKFWNKNFAKWEGAVHETLKFTETPAEIRLKGNLMHYTFDTIDQHIDQINKFSAISAEELFIKGKKPGLKPIFAPFTKFFKDYFLKLGFLDGYYGYIIAKNNAFAKFAKYAKLKQKINEQKAN